MLSWWSPSSSAGSAAKPMGKVPEETTFALISNIETMSSVITEVPSNDELEDSPAKNKIAPYPGDISVVTEKLSKAAEAAEEEKDKNVTASGAGLSWFGAWTTPPSSTIAVDKAKSAGKEARRSNPPKAIGKTRLSEVAKETRGDETASLPSEDRESYYTAAEGREGFEVANCSGLPTLLKNEWGMKVEGSELDKLGKSFSGASVDTPSVASATKEKQEKTAKENKVKVENEEEEKVKKQEDDKAAPPATAPSEAPQNSDTNITSIVIDNLSKGYKSLSKATEATVFPYSHKIEVEERAKAIIVEKAGPAIEAAREEAKKTAVAVEVVQEDKKAREKKNENVDAKNSSPTIIKVADHVEVCEESKTSTTIIPEQGSKTKDAPIAVTPPLPIENSDTKSVTSQKSKGSSRASSKLMRGLSGSTKMSGKSKSSFMNAMNAKAGRTLQPQDKGRASPTQDKTVKQEEKAADVVESKSTGEKTKPAEHHLQKVATAQGSEEEKVANDKSTSSGNKNKTKDPRQEYDYFQVVISNNTTDMMIRLPSGRDHTFADLRREIEEDADEEYLPFKSFKFTVEANGLGVYRKQEKKWKVRDYDLTNQGDGSYKHPYRVYIKEAK